MSRPPKTPDVFLTRAPGDTATPRTPRPPRLPATQAPSGVVFTSHANYARDVVHAAFEMLGGLQSYVEWAEENPNDFYNKHFTKTIQRDVSVTQPLTVEGLVEELDDVTDADFEDLQDGRAED